MHILEQGVQGRVKGLEVVSLRNWNFSITGEVLWILGLGIGWLEVGVWV